ncbi:MAG: TlpA disulfide reductase family protein, partial [Gillisia sp.]
MKKFLAAFVVLSIFSCNKQSEGYSVSGTVKNVDNGKMVYVSKLGENNQPQKIDSVAIKDGEFNLDLPEVDKPNLNILNVEGLNGNVIYISENEPLHFEIYKDSLPASKVTGGKENELFTDYINHLKSVNKTVMNSRMQMQAAMASKDSVTFKSLQQKEDTLRTQDMEFKKEFVKNHPDSFVSVLVLTDMANMQAPVGEVKDLYDSLSEDVKQTSFGKNLKEELDKRSATEVGSKAPDFSAPNPDGKEVSLKDAMGKVTLIDFWASWCKPCRAENPHVVEIYKKYHDQGFNIIGVSLDREGQKDKWLEAIKDDNLTWTQVSHLQFWQEPIAQKYGVRAIPAQFI